MENKVDHTILDGSIRDIRVRYVLEVDPDLVEEYLSTKAIANSKGVSKARKRISHEKKDAAWEKICKIYHSFLFS